MEEIAELKMKLEKLQSDLDVISNAMAVVWEDKKTDSGIELAGGPTTIERKGVIISTVLIPSPKHQGAMELMLVVRRDDGVFGLQDPGSVRPTSKVK